jgi:phosphoadenosine phosphosulfate reductase
MESFDTLNLEFEKASPQDILRWGCTTYDSGLALVTSFQPTGMVTLHMLKELGFDVAVLTLDTGLLFPETYALMDEVEQTMGIKITRLKPEYTVIEQNETYGEALWSSNPDLCCQMRKVAPLEKALSRYDAWITGLRRDQSEGRANTPVLSWDKRHHNTKIAPFATWTEDMIWLYINAHGLPYNKLHDQGYPSIGCLTCTKAVANGEDKRAGRWANSRKTECGIHVSQLIFSQEDSQSQAS